MLKAVSVKAAGTWSGQPADVVVLNAAARLGKDGANGRQYSTVSGKMIDLGTRGLPNTRAGDAYVLEDGAHVEVIGQPEALIEVRPQDEAALVRIAWQLGNHHLPMQILGKKLRLTANDEIAALLAGLGAKVMKIEAPFDPEGGAYLAQVEHHHDHGHACGCGHDHHDHHHHHDHDHKHAHAHDHAHHHGHVHDHKHEHKHGHECCGGHGHGHKHD